MGEQSSVLGCGFLSGLADVLCQVVLCPSLFCAALRLDCSEKQDAYLLPVCRPMDALLSRHFDEFESFANIDGVWKSSAIWD